MAEVQQQLKDGKAKQDSSSSSTTPTSAADDGSKEGDQYSKKIKECEARIKPTETYIQQHTVGNGDTDFDKNLATFKGNLETPRRQQRSAKTALQQLQAGSSRLTSVEKKGDNN